MLFEHKCDQGPTDRRFFGPERYGRPQKAAESSRLKLLTPNGTHKWLRTCQTDQLIFKNLLYLKKICSNIVNPRFCQGDENRDRKPNLLPPRWRAVSVITLGLKIDFVEKCFAKSTTNVFVIILDLI